MYVMINDDDEWIIIMHMMNDDELMNKWMNENEWMIDGLMMNRIKWWINDDEWWYDELMMNEWMINKWMMNEMMNRLNQWMNDQWMEWNDDDNEWINEMI